MDRSRKVSVCYPRLRSGNKTGQEFAGTLFPPPSHFHKEAAMLFRTFFTSFFARNCLLAATIISPAVPALAQGAGSWQTSGNQIIDANNRTVRIAGINWYGFETTDEVVHGLWAQDYHAILNAIKSNGYNTIRLPYSNQMVESPIVPSNISYFNGSGPINTDLKGLNSLEIMDKIITAAGSDGLRVVLVHHRSEA